MYSAEIQNRLSPEKRMNKPQPISAGATCAFTILALSLFASCHATRNASSEEASQDRTFYMGFSPFPWDMTAEAVNATRQFITQNGNILAHHFDGGVPWTEALENKPFHPTLENDWKDRRKISSPMKTLVSVTPLNGGRNGLALYRGKDENMPLPDQFKGKALNDPIVKTAYLNYCRRAVEHFRPDYFAIGIEVNELIHNSPKQWPQFVELYKYIYSELKKDHPRLPIFATVTLHNLTNPGWKDLKTQQEKIREFLPCNDIAGISYYPFMAGQSEKPTATLDWIRSFTDKPIAITETGYPAETIRLKSFNLTIPSDPTKQAVYFETLLDRANRDHYLFVVAFLYRDYDALWERIKATAPEAFIVWKDCGLIDEKGSERPAYGVWKRYFSMKRVDTVPSKSLGLPGAKTSEPQISEIPQTKAK
jgi:hypothetical protein